MFKRSLRIQWHLHANAQGKHGKSTGKFENKDGHCRPKKMPVPTSPTSPTSESISPAGRFMAHTNGQSACGQQGGATAELEMWAEPFPHSHLPEINVLILFGA